MRIVWSAVLLATIACGEPPIVLSPAAQRVRVEPTSESNNEWLHRNCSFEGSIDGKSADDVRQRAALRGSNYVEVLTVGESRNDYRVEKAMGGVAFKCPDVPWRRDASAGP